MRLVRSILPAVASFAAACGASDPSFASLRAARPSGGDVISPRTGSLRGKKQRAKKKKAALTASANTARLRNGLRTPSPSSAMMASSAAGAAAPEKPALRIDTAARAEEGRGGPFAHLSRPASPAERRGMRESLASKAKARQQLSRRLSEEVHRKLRNNASSVRRCGEWEDFLTVVRDLVWRSDAVAQRAFGRGLSSDQLFRRAATSPDSTRALDRGARELADDLGVRSVAESAGDHDASLAVDAIVAHLDEQRRDAGPRTWSGRARGTSSPSLVGLWEHLGGGLCDEEARAGAVADDSWSHASGESGERAPSRSREGSLDDTFLTTRPSGGSASSEGSGRRSSRSSGSDDGEGHRQCGDSPPMLSNAPFPGAPFRCPPPSPLQYCIDVARRLEDDAEAEDALAEAIRNSPPLSTRGEGALSGF